MKKIFKLSLVVLSLCMLVSAYAEQRVCMSDNILCPAPPLVQVPLPTVVAPIVKEPYCKPQPIYHTPVIPLQYFDNIEARGDMELIIKTDNKSPQLQAEGDLRILRNLNAKVYGQTLVITRKDEINLRDCPIPRLTIHANYLRRLAHVGNGNMYVNGIVNLEELRQFGAGIVQIYWINSAILSVCANGNGNIAIAGVAQQLNANVAGQIQLDARFLRTHFGFIRALQCSRADVWVKDSLNAFAQGHSNIYYFTKPLYIYTALVEGGSVLDMSKTHAAVVRFR